MRVPGRSNARAVAGAHGTQIAFTTELPRSRADRTITSWIGSHCFQIEFRSNGRDRNEADGTAASHERIRMCVCLIMCRGARSVGMATSPITLGSPITFGPAGIPAWSAWPDPRVNGNRPVARATAVRNSNLCEVPEGGVGAKRIPCAGSGDVAAGILRRHADTRRAVADVKASDSRAHALRRTIRITALSPLQAKRRSSATQRWLRSRARIDISRYTDIGLRLRMFRMRTVRVRRGPSSQKNFSLDFRKKLCRKTWSGWG